MRPIPQKLKDEMKRRPEYRDGYCIFHNRVHFGKKIEWHHNLIFAGQQVNEIFAILPICEKIHEKANRKQVRERLDWIMLNRATDEELRYFSKANDLIRKRDMLNEKYANEKNHALLPGDEDGDHSGEAGGDRAEERMDP